MHRRETVYDVDAQLLWLPTHNLNRHQRENGRARVFNQETGPWKKKTGKKPTQCRQEQKHLAANTDRNIPFFSKLLREKKVYGNEPLSTFSIDVDTGAKFYDKSNMDNADIKGLLYD